MTNSKAVTESLVGGVVVVVMELEEASAAAGGDGIVVFVERRSGSAVVWWEMRSAARECRLVEGRCCGLYIGRGLLVAGVVE